MTEENKEVIEDENLEEENLDGEEGQDQEDEVDYKALAEESKARADKFEGRFKKTAKELNLLKKTNPKDTDGVSDQVSKQVAEEMYYANNPVAKEYKTEIKEIQAQTGMTPEDALTFYIAKNKPELVGKQPSSVGVDGVAKPVEGDKAINDMEYEDLFPNDKKW